MKDISREELVGDINTEGVVEGMHDLVAAVIGEAIKPDNTYRLPNGQMNRPERRGGETKTWLATESGKYWLKLADLTGVIDSHAIVTIANDSGDDRVSWYLADGGIPSQLHSGIKMNNLLSSHKINYLYS